MKRASWSLRVVGVLAAMCLAAGPLTSARAATLTDQDQVPLQTTNFNKPMSVTQFDPALGTLTGVKLTVTSELQAAGGYENLNASPYPSGNSYHFLINQQIDITQGASTLLTSSAAIDQTLAVPALPAFDGVLDFAGASGFTDAPTITPGSQVYNYALPGDIAPFIGLGTVGFNAVTVATSTQYPPNQLVTLTSSKAAATVSVEYTYTPVPEPATLGLVLVGLPLLLRRRA